MGSDEVLFDILREKCMIAIIDVSTLVRFPCIFYFEI